MLDCSAQTNLYYQPPRSTRGLCRGPHGFEIASHGRYLHAACRPFEDIYGGRASMPCILPVRPRVPPNGARLPSAAVGGRTITHGTQLPSVLAGVLYVQLEGIQRNKYGNYNNWILTGESGNLAQPYVELVFELGFNLRNLACRMPSSINKA